MILACKNRLLKEQYEQNMSVLHFRRTSILLPSHYHRITIAHKNTCNVRAMLNVWTIIFLRNVTRCYAKKCLFLNKVDRLIQFFLRKCVYFCGKDKVDI